MGRGPNLWISRIVRIWNVQKHKSFDFNNFYDLACTEAQIVGLQRFKRFGMCKGSNLLISMILMILHVQKLQSLDFKDCKVSACAET